MQQPSVGRIVHYYDLAMKDLGPNGTGPYAAIVTSVDPAGRATLEAFPRRQLGEIHGAVPYSEDGSQPSADVSEWWTWPPKV